MLISIVIPVYNSDKTIELTVNDVKEVFSNLQKKYDYEIILVNDGSKDSSEQVIQNICSIENKVKFINLSKNFGQHNAIMAGLNVANGDYVICMDDDLQTPASGIGELIKKLEEGYDVVYAEYKQVKQNLFRRLGSKFANKTAEFLINKPKDIYGSSFFICRKYIINEIIKYKNSFPFVAGLIFRTTQNIGRIFIEHREREIGRSNYNLFKLIRLWMNSFTSFSVKPLRIASLFGFILSIISFLMLIIIVIRKLLNPLVQLGWTSIVGIVMLFGGIQLICTGLLGEYIGRIYLCINRNPQYVVKNTINIKR